VSKSQPASEAETDAEGRTTTAPRDARHNPSYPARTHTHERPHWLGVLRSCDDKIATALQGLDGLAGSGDRPRRDRLHAQLLGCRDQVAGAVRRLPGETGDLYEEDKHSLEEAVAALDRVLAQWDAAH